MAFLKLTLITRNNTTSELDRENLEIKFGEQSLWGPGQITPGVPLTVPTPNIPSQSAGPYNIPAQLQLWIHVKGLGSFIVPTDSNPGGDIGAIPGGSGRKTLTYQFGNASYTLDYYVDVNIGTATLALAGGIANAFVIFLTTVFNLIASYVQTLGFLIVRALRGTNRSENDRIDRR